jgi:hypothetical protein
MGNASVAPTPFKTVRRVISTMSVPFAMSCILSVERLHITSVAFVPRLLFEATVTGDFTGTALSMPDQADARGRSIQLSMKTGKLEVYFTYHA